MDSGEICEINVPITKKSIVFSGVRSHFVRYEMRENLNIFLI